MIYKPFLPFLCILAASTLHAQENWDSRRQNAVNLYGVDGLAATTPLSRNADAELRRAHRNLTVAATVRLNVDSLLGDYLEKKTLSERTYWTSSQLVRLTHFDGSDYFLQNGRIFQIKENVTGWVGSVVDHDGNRIGSAQFEIYDGGRARGHLSLPGRFKIEIYANENSDDYDIVEIAHTLDERQTDSTDMRTKEEREQARQAWEEKLSEPKYDERRQARDKILRDIAEVDDSQ